MKLHRVHSLDSSQIRQLQTMVNKCTDSDGTRLSFPFDEADLFLYFEHDGSIVSAIAFIPIEGLLYECSAFTDPEFRGHGLFSGLLDAGIDELPEDSELIFYADKRNSAAAAVLEAIGAEMNSEEHMMKLLPENFSIIDCRSSQTRSDVSALDLIADIHSECLNLDGALTLRFHSDHAVINFSVFPSHYYLYGFEVEESCRGKGYGTKFLSTVLAQLLNGNAAAIEHSPLSPETSYHISDVRSAGAAADNTAPRPVLLQVSGGNAPALTLYKKTGFRITETLCCYLY